MNFVAVNDGILDSNGVFVGTIPDADYYIGSTAHTLGTDSGGIFTCFRSNGEYIKGMMLEHYPVVLSNLTATDYLSVTIGYAGNINAYTESYPLTAFTSSNATNSYIPNTTHWQYLKFNKQNYADNGSGVPTASGNQFTFVTLKTTRTNTLTIVRGDARPKPKALRISTSVPVNDYNDYYCNLINGSRLLNYDGYWMDTIGTSTWGASRGSFNGDCFYKDGSTIDGLRFNNLTLNNNTNNTIISGTNDYTVEFWIYPQNTDPFTGENPVFVAGNSTRWIYIYYNLTDWIVSINGASFTVTTIDYDQWRHISFSRKNGIFRFFKNGTCVYTNSANFGFSIDSNSDARIGYNTYSNGLMVSYYGGINQDTYRSKQLITSIQYSQAALDPLAPKPGSLSIRGTIIPIAMGKYRFVSAHHDGMRMNIDGTSLIDNYNTKGVNRQYAWLEYTNSSLAFYETGSKHSITITYYRSSSQTTSTLTLGVSNTKSDTVASTGELGNTQINAYNANDFNFLNTKFVALNPDSQFYLNGFAIYNHGKTVFDITKRLYEIALNDTGCTFYLDVPQNFNKSIIKYDYNTNIKNLSTFSEITLTKNSPLATQDAGTPYNIVTTSVDGSLRFTGGSIINTNNSLVGFGYEDFTIECWVADFGSVGDTLIFGDNPGVSAYIVGSNKAIHVYLNNTLVIDTNEFGTYYLPTNAWTHVCVVRNNSNISLYINGIIQRTYWGTINSFNLNTSNTLNIGGNINGHISNFKIYKYAKYTANFGVSPVYLNTRNEAVLNYENSNYTLKYLSASNIENTYVTYSISNNSKNIVNYSGTISAVNFHPFNGQTESSLIFRGDINDFIYIDNEDANSWLWLPRNSGTIEAWVYLNSYATSDPENYQHRSIYSIGDNRLNFGVNASGNLQFSWFRNTYNSFNGSTVIPLSTWTHVAFVLNSDISNNAQLYVNGNLDASTNFNNFTFASDNAKSRTYIGKELSGIGIFNGYISNIRVTKSNPVYTSNFTPLTTSLAIDNKTAILYKHPHSNTYISNVIELRNLKAANVNINSLYLGVSSGLYFDPLSSATITINNENGIKIYPFATLSIGSSSTPTNYNNTNSIILPTYNTKIDVYDFGNFLSYGSTKTPYTYLNTDSLSGNSTFTVKDSIYNINNSNWRIGDTLALIQNVTSFSELLNINSFTGSNGFTTNRSIFDHPSINSLPVIPTIANLTRNNKIISKNTNSVVSNNNNFIRADRNSNLQLKDTQISIINIYTGAQSRGFNILNSNAILSSCVVNKNYDTGTYSILNNIWYAPIANFAAYYSSLNNTSISSYTLSGNFIIDGRSAGIEITSTIIPNLNFISNYVVGCAGNGIRLNYTTLSSFNLYDVHIHRCSSGIMTSDDSIRAQSLLTVRNYISADYCSANYSFGQNNRVFSRGISIDCSFTNITAKNLSAISNNGDWGLVVSNFPSSLTANSFYVENLYAANNGNRNIVLASKYISTELQALSVKNIKSINARGGDTNNGLLYIESTNSNINNLYLDNIFVNKGVYHGVMVNKVNNLFISNLTAANCSSRGINIINPISSLFCNTLYISNNGNTFYNIVNNSATLNNLKIFRNTQGLELYANNLFINNCLLSSNPNYALYCIANNITAQNLSSIGNTYGLYLSGNGSHYVNNPYLERNTYSFILNRANNIYVNNPYVLNSSYSFNLINTNNAYLNNVSAISSNYLYYLNNTNNTYLNNSLISSAKYGLSAVETNITTINNVNVLSGSSGIYSLNHKSLSVVNLNTVSSFSGIYINTNKSNNDFTLQNSVVRNNNTYGIILTGISTTPISANIENSIFTYNNIGLLGYYFYGNLKNTNLSYNRSYNIGMLAANNPILWDSVSALNPNITFNTLTAYNNPTLSSGSPFGVGTDGSLRFNGSNQYLALPQSSDYVLNGDFTIEFFINLRTSTGSVYLDQWNGIQGIGSWQIGNNSSRTLQLFYDGSNYINGPVLPLNTWNHIAVSRKTNILRLYVNGLSTNSVSYSGVFGKNDFIYVGGQKYLGNPTIFNMPASLSNLRMVKDVGLYSLSTYTVPTNSLGPVSGTITVLYQYPYNNRYINKLLPTSVNCVFLSGYNTHEFYIKDSAISNTPFSYYNIPGITFDGINFKNFHVDNTDVGSINMISAVKINEGSYIFNNCSFNNIPISKPLNGFYQPYNIKSTGFSFMSYNKLSGYHITYLPAGTRSIDTTIHKEAYASERLTPSSSTKKLRSGSKFVALNAGDSSFINVYVRKSTLSSNGVAYNGSSPRLILKRNGAMGVNNDIILGQATGTSEDFALLAGLTPTVIDTGVLEFYVDCDGTQGWINVDSWSAN
jgi:hypothetical protein